ncbi:MAG: DNA polymerase III subunit delta [Nitrospinota bacterium]
MIHERFVTLAIAPLKGAQAKGWLLTELKEKHAKMTKEAVETLIDLAGTDLFRLQMELEKLSLFAKGREITTSDVLEMISDNAGESAFEMADAMGRGEAGTALYTLNKLLLAGEAPLKIFGLIVRQLRIILFTRTLLKKGIPPKNIPAKAGFQPFLLSKYTKMSAGFDYETFKEMFSKLPETDKYLKSGFSQKMILEKLILDFCTLPKSRN